MTGDREEEDEPLESTVFKSAPFGKYTLLRKVGKGGMGRVFEAVDTVLNRRVAIKLMAPSDPDGLEGPEIDEERFLREAQVSANLSKHPHIVSVYEAGIIEGKRFLAMEFVDGVQLEDWREVATTRDQIALLRDVALAVHHANENGIVHRDLKPANVIVDAKNQPHVTDFGLAKTLSPEFSRTITTSGLVVGTPAYMSPEQAQGLRNVDARSDVYSLGVMLYEALTRRPPFDAETPMQLLVKVVEHPPPPPSTIITTPGHPAKDPRLESLCLRALAKKAPDRPASARIFAEELSRWLAESGASGPLLRPELPARKPTRGLAAAAVLAALLLAGAASVFLRPGPAPVAAPGTIAPVLQGHGDKVLSVAWSARGGVLASGGADRTVLLWDVAGGKPSRSIGPHAGKVESVAFSPDGARVVAGTELGDGLAGEVKVWEVPSGRLKFDLKGPDDGVNCVAYSRDGRWIAAGDRAGCVRVWDAGSGELKTTIAPAHESSVRGVVFTKDGRSVISGSWDRTAKLWDLSSGQERMTFRGHTEGLWGLAVSPDGVLLATASSDHTVKLWEIGTGAERRTLRGHGKEVSSVAFSPDGALVAAGGWDRRVLVWDAATGTERMSFPGHQEAVWSVSFSPDGRTLATAGLDRQVRLWRIPPD